MTDRYRSLDDWYSLILECRGSGMTDAEWCRINSISRDAFYSALKRLRKKPVEIPPSSRGVIVHDLTKPSSQDVVKVPTISDPGPRYLTPENNDKLSVSDNSHTIQIHLGSLQISMTNDADPSLVAETLKLLRGVL